MSKILFNLFTKSRSFRASTLFKRKYSTPAEENPDALDAKRWASLKWKATMFLRLGISTTVSVTALGIYLEKAEIYDNFLIPIVQKLDSELSHRLTVLLFKYVPFPKSRYTDTPFLECKIKHLHFKNPVGIAAGFDKNAEAISALDRIGFGFVEIGSVTPKPQPGNDKPRVFRLLEDKAVINRYGFNSDGHEIVYQRVKELKQKSFDSLLGINLGKNKTSEDAAADYVKGVEKFYDVADYFVINVSSPNTPGLRSLQNKENLRSLLLSVITARDNANVTPKPLVFLKLAPDLSKEEKEDIASVLKQDKCRVDGLIVSNTTIQRCPQLISEFAKETGGLSGAPLKDLSTRIIAEMYKLTGGSIPIIGVGGISNGRDAYDKIKAGASVVQIYTSFVYHGPPIVAKIKRELQECLREENYTSIQEAVGKGVHLK